MSNNATTLPDTVDAPTTDHDHRPDGDDHAVTDRATTASDRLWAALHARPGGTADELSGDAGIGRSTAAKTLARWAADGTATRLPTDGRRSASRYAVPASADATAPDGTDDAATAPGSPSTGPAVDADTADTTAGIDDAVDEADQSGAVAHSTVGDATTEPSGAQIAAPATLDASGSTPDTTAGADDEAASPAEAVPATAEPDDDATADCAVTGGADTDGASTESGVHGAAPAAATMPARAPRLAPGALHGMVEDYLRDHPDEEFGPTKIGHDLGRSTGAVGNALERLVTAGYAVRTKDRPKRYALAPTEPGASATRSNDDGQE